MLHRYYISYSHPRGNGAVAFNRETPITTWDAVQDIKYAIEQEQGLSGVVILGWQKFEDA